MNKIPRKITVALAGNPNSGKSTIFNNLTGHRQHVGNYPGVTVEKREGICRNDDLVMTVVDLPGIYSLTAYSIEEIVARDYIIGEKPDVVVDIIDSSNLERNLYLATQLLDLGVPLILAFNMSDVAKARGIEFDIHHLSWLLGAPIVEMVGSRNTGTRELLSNIAAVIEDGNRSSGSGVRYGREIEEELSTIQELVKDDPILGSRYNARWAAIKLLESDALITNLVTNPDISDTVKESIEHLQRVFGDNPEIIIADRRYGYISGACQEAVQASVETRHNMSDKVDAVVTSRILGLPIFFLMMYIVFQVTFTIGSVPMGWLESFFGMMSELIHGTIGSAAHSPLRSLLADGIIGGVGGVITFLPNILLLFLAIAVLEDSGYMARAAFIMDHLMHKIGLHGKSFIPLMIGFGCTVPAIMATRILESRRDRITTMLVAPLMSCGARLPIYALIIPAFFPRPWRGPMLWFIYFIGIALAILLAKLLRGTVLRGETEPLVMELPPYRFPTFRGVLIHMWERGSEYVKKAGTVILALSVVLWALTSYPRGDRLDTDLDSHLVAAKALYTSGVDSILMQLDSTMNSDVLIDLLEDALSGQSKDIEGPGAEFQIGTTESVELLPNIVAEIQSVRSTFHSLVDDGSIQANTPEYAILQADMLNRLHRIESNDPLNYSRAMSYIDHIHAPYAHTMGEVERESARRRLAHTYAGRIGTALEPILRPMGFDWRIGTALIGAIAAKEVFVAQMGIVFSVGEAGGQTDLLRRRLRQAYSPLVAFCIMLFTLISTPCIATVVITKKESQSWKWALVQLGGLTLVAYVITTSVYQIGKLIGFGIAVG